MADHAAFWDRMATRYSKSPIADMDAYEHKLDITRRYFSPQTRALEFGCGTVSTALLHAPYVKHYLATDYSAAMIDIAQQKLEAPDCDVDNVTFLQAAVNTLKLDAPVDAVLGLSILHLLEDRQETIRQAFDWLKPGGVFVTSTVCLSDSMWRLIRPIVPIAKLFGLMPTLKFFGEKQLIEEMTQAGFEIDYRWRPEKAPVVFLVAKKPEKQ